MYHYKVFLKNKSESIQLIKTENMCYREDKFICFEVLTFEHERETIYINPDHIIKMIEIVKKGNQ